MRAILQQEEQQVEHNAEADGEAKGAFTNQKRAAGQILAAFQGDIGELLLDLLRAIQVMFGEEASGPAGEVGDQAGDHRRELGIVMLQFAVHHVQLVGQ